MKNLCTFLLCTCIIVCGISASAQTSSIPLNEPNPNKSRLFSALPDHITVSANLFTMLLNVPVGNVITIPISGASKFQGVVVSVVSKYGNSIQNVIVRLTNYEGANLSVSKITNPNGSISYSGRILSLEKGDLYELQSQNGDYSFIKRKFYELVNE